MLSNHSYNNGNDSNNNNNASSNLNDNVRGAIVGNAVSAVAPAAPATIESSSTALPSTVEDSTALGTLDHLSDPYNSLMAAAAAAAAAAVVRKSVKQEFLAGAGDLVGDATPSSVGN